MNDRMPSIQKMVGNSAATSRRPTTEVEVVLDTCLISRSNEITPPRSSVGAFCVRRLFCMGAPNAFRGQSQMKQNISVREAIRAGAVNILCSDYYPSSLVYSTFTLAEETNLTIIESLNLVSLNPAQFIGKGDILGSLEEGKEADIIIVSLDHGIPVISCTIVKGKIVYETHSPSYI